jgi:hypothetical protein
MPSDALTNNWAYLKVELNALERLLLTAVARQKKDQKQADRLLRTQADRAAQHWFQGLMNLEGPVGYDSPPPRPAPKIAKVETSQPQRSTPKLALPMLCEQLNLSSYEKNLILLAIAPEIHRRYAKLYEFLNGGSALLTVDLSLRLLCRNDQEWRLARAKLKSDAPLLRYRLIEVVGQDDRAFLQHSVRLTADLVHYLLAEQTEAADLAQLLAIEEPLPSFPAATPETSPIADVAPPLDRAIPLAAAPHPEPPWQTVTLGLKNFAVGEGFASHLVLPRPLRQTLESLSHELRWGRQIDEDWGFGAWQGRSQPGQWALFSGPAGTGKATAAAAIAQAAGLPLAVIDLDQTVDLPILVAALVGPNAPPVLLIRHADRWLGRQCEVDFAEFVQARSTSGQLTIFSSRRAIALPEFWRSRITHKLNFKCPNPTEREAIWRKVFPPPIELDADIDWSVLARRSLTGGEIVQVARSAAMLALAAQDSTSSQLVITQLVITHSHLQQALDRWAQ